MPLFDTDVVDALMNFFKPKNEDLQTPNATTFNTADVINQLSIPPADNSNVQAGKTVPDLTVRLQDSPQLIAQRLGSPQFNDSSRDPIGDLIKSLDTVPVVKTVKKPIAPVTSKTAPILSTATQPLPGALSKTLADTFSADILKKYQDAYDVSDTNAGVVSPILQASKLTGVDPDILFKIARAESKFNPNAKNANSTATGLFQVIKSTWNGLTPELQKLYGQHGFTNNRKDPLSNAIAGAHYIGSIKDDLASVKKSSDVNARDLYLGLFSGPARAKQVISAMEAGKGNKPASTVYPVATMQDNKGIFYDEKGKVRTLQDVYKRLTDKVA